MGEQGWARGVRCPADDVDVGVGVFWRTSASSGGSQGAQLICGAVVVRKSGDAGLAGGLEGQVPGVIDGEGAASGLWIISTSKRSATITMLSCVAIVETRSEVFGCDIVPVEDRVGVGVKAKTNFEPRG